MYICTKLKCLNRIVLYILYGGKFSIGPILAVCMDDQLTQKSNRETNTIILYNAYKEHHMYIYQQNVKQVK